MWVYLVTNRVNRKRRGKKLTPERRAEISRALTGRPCSSETKRKMRAAWVRRKAESCSM